MIRDLAIAALAIALLVAFWGMSKRDENARIEQIKKSQEISREVDSILDGAIRSELERVLRPQERPF